jgi:Arc/MetJ family transcription regulator
MRCIAMRTNIVLDDRLVERALRFASVKTKKDIVNLALKEFVESHSRLNLLDIKGKIGFAKDYDYKQLRSKSR